MISKFQQAAKQFADRHGYKLRKIKEGRVKITRPNGSTTIVDDFSSAKMKMMSEVYGVKKDKNIFDLD
jgi:hypothetical protein